MAFSDVEKYFAVKWLSLQLYLKKRILQSQKCALALYL